mgnify:CR=1 FL=1
MSSVAKTKRPMSSGRAKRVAKNSLIHIILGITQDCSRRQHC